MLDGGFVLDLDEVMNSIGANDVISIAFPTFGKSLVVDARSNESEGPLVRIMPVAGSPQERIRSLRRIRPRFPKIHELTVILWPRFVGGLVRLGIWERLIEWVAATGDQEAVNACNQALEELRRLERAELTAVVTGENYHTIWPATQ